MTSREIPFDSGPLAEVRVEARAGDGPVTLVFERELSQPPERVWAALTEPDRLARWAPYTSDRDLGQIGDAVLTMLDAPDSPPIPASVRQADRPRRLEHTFGPDTLCWDLTAAGSGTRLTLRHTVAGHSWLPKVAAGWHLCLVVADRFLGGDPIPPIRGMLALDYGWQDLHDAYAQKFPLPADPA